MHADTHTVIYICVYILTHIIECKYMRVCMCVTDDNNSRLQLLPVTNARPVAGSCGHMIRQEVRYNITHYVLKCNRHKLIRTLPFTLAQSISNQPLSLFIPVFVCLSVFPCCRHLCISSSHTIQ